MKAEKTVKAKKTVKAAEATAVNSSAMRLNTLSPGPWFQNAVVFVSVAALVPASAKLAVKGHKGQRARAGGYHKVGFEGGPDAYAKTFA